MRLVHFGWTCAVHMLAPPLNFLYVVIQQSGSLKPSSQLKRSLSGFVRMFSNSFITSSMVQLAHCKTFITSWWMGWSFVHVCLAIADLSIRPFMHVSPVRRTGAFNRNVGKIGFFAIKLSTREQSATFIYCLCSNTTTIHEYYFKSHELYKQLLHVVYVQFNTLPSSLYVFLITNCLLRIVCTVQFQRRGGCC